MTHDEIRILLSAYVDGEVTPSEKNIVQEHLSSCVSCQKEYQQYMAISSKLTRWDDQSLSPDEEMNINQKFFKRREPMFTKRTMVGLTTTLAIFIVVGSVVQQYVQRSMVGRIKDASILGADARTQGNLKSAMDDTGGQFKSPYPVSSPPIHNEEKTINGDMFSVPGGGIKGNEGQFGQSLSINLNQVNSGYAKRSIHMSTAYEKGDTVSFYNPESSVAQEESNSGSYHRITENNFLNVSDNPLSTFSVDVDTASYSKVRRFLQQNQLPPKDAVRIEEMVNYFSYNYPKPAGQDPFSMTTNLAICPWNPGHQLLHVGLKGRSLDGESAPPSQLTFLIDVSGSMSTVDRLPLLKDSFKMMVQQLRPQDKVAIVVYAGSAGLVLEPTSGDQKQRILEAIDRLQAGGSTAGGEGINLAYQIAKENFISGGNNRVILATDGDFNVGVSDTAELVRTIEQKRKDGIFLTVLGFGEGNYKDGRMQELADKGNGNYYYIDSLKEGRKVLVSELGSTLFTIAKDVKIQIEFNPANIKSYRLVGYEKRILAKEDFNNDKKDAGEIGAGHTVTALYEIIPANSLEEVSGSVDPLKYQQQAKAIPTSNKELLTIKLRYKQPEEDKSQLISMVVHKADIKDEPTGDFAWAASVAEFGMLLRKSSFKGQSSYEHVVRTAMANRGQDPFGLKDEFIDMVQTASQLDQAQPENIQFK